MNIAYGFYSDPRIQFCGTQRERFETQGNGPLEQTKIIIEFEAIFRPFLRKAYLYTSQ